MSDFTRASLTMMLSWLRSFVNNLWLLLNSEGGSSWISFLRENWKMVFLLACIGGFVVDRVIYLIRWRPYYVWGTKLSRLRRGRRGETDEAGARYAPAGSVPVSKAYVQADSADMPLQTQMTQDTFYRTPAAVPSPFVQTDESGHTPGYAPLASSQGFAPETITQAYPYASGGAELSGEPVFDEDAADSETSIYQQPYAPYSSLQEESPEELAEPPQEPFENPAMNLAPAFGIAKSEPAQYLMDVQDSFAKPHIPEELYPEPVSPAKNEPVHPGLDLDTFQQNIGLSPSVSALESKPEAAEPLLKPAVDFPNTTFVPYYQSGEQDTAQRSRRTLSGLAKKARSLVSMHDEDNPPSIRDLQPTMDIKDAFHAPVFPRKSDESGAEL